jgi:hypothetical protein
MVLPVAFGSPKQLGGLDTFDPLDARVTAWWKAKAGEIYRAIPDLAGFVMKADSENQTGPSAYGRTIADAARPLARALKPHGGLLLYRAFVYNHKLDWNDPKADRARAAYDNFHPLDGQFDDNVVIQTKNGPIDFQVREPASPLFSGLTKTNQADEERYGKVKAMLEYQSGAAQLWRDAVAGWFRKTSGIPDAQGRVGPYPGRIEAESMTLDGYAPRKVTWWETASGGTAVECALAQCSASLRHDGAPGSYTLRVRYFDYPRGQSSFRLSVAGQVVDGWTATAIFPLRVFEPDGASSTRRVVSGVQLRPGDEIRIEGVPEKPETADLDYLEILPDDR